MARKKKKQRDRKHTELAQWYKHWRSLMKMRITIDNRIKAAEEGRSNLDPDLWRQMKRDLRIEEHEAAALREMTAHGRAAGPIWDWLTEHKGIGPGIAAKLIAEIDDIGLFDMVSKLWRFSGMGVVNGKAEKSPYGETRRYNGNLKATLVGPKGVVVQFKAHHTPGYYEMLHGQEERLRRKHPDVECGKCGVVWSDECKGKKGHTQCYTDVHISRMARRIVAKVFLKQFWLAWRTLEGLPLTRPWSPQA